jgi:serine/threonine protein kinase/DNA-binding SARP family transcriptional activator
MSSLRIYLFGAPRLEQEGQNILIRRRKAMALLAYLAVTSQPHSRDALAALLWPEYDQSGARANLRRDLSRLKRALGDQALLVEQAHVGLAPQLELHLDVAEFQQRLAKVQKHSHLPEQLCADCLTALGEAATLYADDFMAGFTLPDSPAFDEWQFFQREGLRQALAGALKQLAGWHAGRQEFERAIEYGRRWLALDPLHEAAQRQLMRLYAWSGQQAAALRQYQECVRLLDEELGVEPAAETVALYEAIRSRQLEMPVGKRGSGGAGEQGSESASLRVGELLAAEVSLPPERRYVVEELLASGSHGEVYRGRDQVTGQPVVIKRLRPELVRQEPEFVARFVREGETLRRLNHPNIVCMLDTFEEAGQHHIVMEYVPGGSLRTLLDEQPRLPLARLLQIALELADALSRAHHLHIIHRDIKPENVLLAADGAPRLTDFGVARLEREDTRLTPTGSLLGSPAYMSPEALRGEELDARSDIWSYGALLYEMLAGRRPFEGEHMTAIIASVLADPLPDVTRFRLDVPAPLENLLRWMLAKERDKRPASMRQVAAALEAVQAGEQGSRGAGEIRGHRSSTPSLRQPQIGPPFTPLPTHNLPSQTTPFLGRETELAEIIRLLQDEPVRRLIILQGPGGIGKTRLALAVAEAALSAFTDGVYFVPLAALISAEQIVTALADSLNIYYEADELKQQLLGFLRDKEILLLMDNFEHVLPGAEVITEILEAAPRVKILVTSRERLSLSDEVVYSLSGLTFPEKEALPLAINVDPLAYGAVALLLQRGQLLRSSLQLQPEDLPHVMRICRLVQGMPLALILAASWLELLSFAEIADEITRNLDFLESEARDLPQRQRSVRAVFSASWQMLDEPAQSVLLQLCVFRGPFSRAEAQGVADVSLHTLLALAHKSWLQRAAGNLFQIHELLRQYVAEKLTADPSLWREAHNRHALYYARFLQLQAVSMKGPEQQEAFTAVGTAFDNIRAAWRWLIEQGQFETIVQQMLPAIFRYCETRVRGWELLPLLNATLETLPATANKVARRELYIALLTAKGAFYRNHYPVRFESFGMVLPAHEESIRQAWSLMDTLAAWSELNFWSIVLVYLYGRIVNREQGINRMQGLLTRLRQENQRWALAFALQHLVQLMMLDLRDESEATAATEHLTQALAIFENLGDARESGYTLRALGQLHRLQQNFAEAIHQWDLAQQKLEAVGDWAVAAEINWQMGDAHLQQGNVAAALRHYRRMSEAYAQMGHRRYATMLSKESYEALRYGDPEHARRTREQALALAHEAGDLFVEAWCTWEMGEILRVTGDPIGARQWFERSRVLFEKFADKTGETFYYRGLGDLAYAQDDHRQAQRHFQQSLKRAQANGHGWAMAYALAGLGRAATGLGQLDAARLHLAAALHSAQQTSDRGITLVVLSSVAQLYAAMGERESAIEVATFVAEHPVSWRETRVQAAAVLEAITDLSPERLAEAQGRGRQRQVWPTAAELQAALS